MVGARGLLERVPLVVARAKAAQEVAARQLPGNAASYLAPLAVMDEGMQMVVEPPVGDFEELDGLSVEEEYAAEERIKG